MSSRSSSVAWLGAAIVCTLSVALAIAQQPAKDAPAATAGATVDSADLIRQILDQLNERPSIRKTPGFADGVCQLCDQVINGATDAGHKETALLAKFKILHEAGVDGDKTADEKVLKLAEPLVADSRKKVSAFARFVMMERRVIDAAKLSPAELKTLFTDLKSYLAKERLLERHLRMATLTDRLVDTIAEKDRKPLRKELGNLYAKSADLDLAHVGLRMTGAPVGEGDALIGQPLQLAGYLTSGEPLRWENYRDRIVIVDFWATWCAPCRQEMPKVREAFDKYRRHDVEFIGVSLDTDLDALRKFLDEARLPWITLAGRTNQELATKYSVTGIPMFFLIDKEGKIAARAHNVSALIPKLEELLKIKSAPPATK